MMPRLPIFLLLSAGFGAPAMALDAVFLRGENPRAGSVESATPDGLRLKVPLPPPPGARPDAPPIFATVLIPLADILRVEFEPDPARDALLANPQAGDRAALENLWKKWEPFLGLPNAPAGATGVAFAESLLLTKDPTDASRALELFGKVEEKSWDAEAVMRARQGRLRAMIATGNAAAAVGEALELEKITENPTVIVEAKYILGQAAEQNLRLLVENNPRWEEDIWVIPEHKRLLNEALDEYLFPYLFFGSEEEAAARGLWGAVGVYDFVGDRTNARECARDLVTLYPSSPQAAEAQNYLASLPEDLLAEDPEAEVRQDAPEDQSQL